MRDIVKARAELLMCAGVEMVEVAEQEAEDDQEHVPVTAMMTMRMMLLMMMLMMMMMVLEDGRWMMDDG